MKCFAEVAIANHDPGHGPRAPPQAAARGQAQAGLWTCPMHPQIRRPGPGACPICGMALEPLQPTVSSAPDPALAEMARRFWVGLVLAAPVVALDMGAEMFDLGRVVAPAISAWLQAGLATPVVVWSGAPFFARAWTSLRTGRLNMFTLIAMGVGVAWLYSVAALLAPGAFPAAFRTMGGGPPLYFEAAAMITVLALLGQVLELGARARTSGALKALLALAPKTARRIKPDGGDEDVGLDRIRLGDRLRVRPGEAVAVDGVILEGAGSIDESLVTGESMPVSKAVGDPVIGGALNRAGAFVMRADRIGADTLLAKIVALVAEAQRSRAPIQGLADRVAAWFTPTVMGAAALTFAVWAWIGPEPRLSFGLAAAVSVLIVACPCALGLATPISIMVGIGRGAQAGVLVRDAEALERFEKVDTLVIDKTGTLTEGRPAVTAIEAAPGVDETDLLRLAASLERGSAHPLADAVVRAAADRKVALADPADVEAPAGQGVAGTVETRAVIVGKAAFLDARGVVTRGLEAKAAALGALGATVVFVAIDGRLAGVLGIADPVKASAPVAIAALKAAGVRVIMMTGDTAATAEAVARQVGVGEVRAGVLPQDKAEVVRDLRRQGRVVAMAGDGVNDAPALAAADVGVAMGRGSDVAIESAGMTLLSGDLGGLVKARRLSRAAMNNIRENLIFAFAYNAIGIPIAAGVLYPAFHLLLSPALAAAAMALSSVSVISNALRLRGVKL